MATAINTVSNYQSGMYPFPSDEIPTSQKNHSWAKEWCQAMYAAWVNDRTGIPYSQIEELRELRNYGAGTQDIKKYQKILLDESEDDGELEGWMNINWDVFSVMPKFKNVVRGTFEDQEYDIVATAIDPISGEEKEKTKFRKWFLGRYRPLVEAVNKFAGYEPPTEWLPNNLQELELYEKGGGFKLEKEKNIEDGIRYSLYISDWKEVKRKLIDDAMDINCMAVKDYTDQYTRKAKVRYVDPLNLIIQYSKHWDYRNSEYGGEVIRETISNIRKNTNLSEEELRNIAQFYNGVSTNPYLASWSEEDLRFDNGSYKYDSFLIDVLDAEWISIDQKYFTTRKTSRGDTLTYEEKSKKVYNTDKRKTTIQKYKTVYRAKWIIGTDHIYDFGLQYDIPRPGKKEVELSYKFYKLPGRSIVSLSVPNLDQLSLTFYKLQNAIAMAANPGIAVEYTSLMNMSLGGDKLDPLDILAIRRDQGDLIYKLTTIGGRPNVPGGMRPIQELEGGLGRQLQEYIQLFEMNINFIRDITGINQIADASTPNPNQSVGGSQLAVAATIKALKPIYSGYIRIKNKVSVSISLRIQMLVKYDKEAYKGYIPVMGEAGVKMISVGAEVKDVDYAVMIIARPTAERKQIILQAAQQAMQPDKDGYTGIEMSDFLLIERMAEVGNLKFAELYLNARSIANKERQRKLQQENMDYASKRDQETAMIKAQELRKNEEFNNQLKKDFASFNNKLEEDMAYKQHIWRMEEIKLEKDTETQKQEVPTT